MDGRSAFHPIPFKTLRTVAALCPSLQVVANDSREARLILQATPVYLTCLPITHSALWARPALELAIRKVGARYPSMAGRGEAGRW